MTNTELDREVAEAQGWVCDEYGPDGWVWRDNKGNRKCIANEYHPTTNWQQCGELIEKYKLSLWFSRADNLWVCTDHRITDITGKTPQEAVCKAVVVMEGE